MNPSPADNSINQETNNETHQVPQLENETPLDITIYPSNENPNQVNEPEKFTSAETENLSIETNSTESLNINQNNELPPLPVIEITSDLQNKVLESKTESTPINSPEDIKPIQSEPVENNNTQQEVNPILNTENPVLNKENFLANQNNQKIIAIVGGVLGLLIVGSISIYFYLQNVESKTVGSTAMPATFIPDNITPPAIQNNINLLSLNEYQLKIDTIYAKYLNTISNNPITTSDGMISVNSIEFISNETFALATEINETDVPETLKMYNMRLQTELNNIVMIYDSLLKEYKTSNSISLETRNKFNIDLNTANSNLKTLVDEIKNLK